MKSLKTKILWALVTILSLLQLSLALMMVYDGGENFCHFDEHCILQSIADNSGALQPAYSILLPVFFVFISPVILRLKNVGIYTPPPNFKFLQTLEAIVKRE